MGIIGNSFYPVKLSSVEWFLDVFFLWLVNIYKTRYISSLGNDLIFHGILINIMEYLANLFLCRMADPLT